ncbi:MULTISPECIES: hypothetical protein [unclassified Methanosarcina]|uniref:hypothetical protein n=1 Tax=unclassified Methanosarcina TaxID=2644672 RepID=UPI0012E09B2A|nr:MULTISPECIES: hypothetical protein [unclassified Methanosarcina]
MDNHRKGSKNVNPLPYVSEFLKDTDAELQIPILRNETVAGLKAEKGLTILEENKFISSKIPSVGA